MNNIELARLNLATAILNEDPVSAGNNRDRHYRPKRQCSTHGYQCTATRQNHKNHKEFENGIKN